MLARVDVKVLRATFRASALEVSWAPHVVVFEYSILRRYDYLAGSLAWKSYADPPDRNKLQS
jgi:hypothetical protein